VSQPIVFFEIKDKWTEIMLKTFLRFDSLQLQWKVTTVIIVSTLVIIIERYRAIFIEKSLDYLLLFLIIPLIVIGLFFKENPSDYGFKVGDWKAGLVFTLAGWLITSIIVAIVAQSTDFRNYYAPIALPPLELILKTGMDLFGWEFLFRGFLLFALLPVCGPYAIFIQAIPFSIAHIGKPELETLSCIFGGSLFGYIAWRTRSFLYPFLIHWYLSTITVIVATRSF
jgi:uncharacterized protein